MSRSHNCNNRRGLLSHAACCAIEALEQRMHLSYGSRGKISVIVEGGVASQLAAELGQLEQDMIADGWTVSMHMNAPEMNDNANVWDNDDVPPSAVTSTLTQYRTDLQTVKGMIAADFPTGVPSGKLGAVLIIGHVTVPYSGTTKYDTHGDRAMPTDQYYADLDGTPQTWGDDTANVTYVTTPVYDFRGDNGWEFTWNTPGDGRFDANAAPGDAQLVTIGSGNFTLTFGGQTISPSLPDTADEEDIRVALNGLSSIGGVGGSVTVAPHDGGGFDVRFQGTLEGDQTLMTSGGSASVSSLDTGGLELMFGSYRHGELGARV